MIISCPECSSRFNIDQNLIPKDGRLLQCSNCMHKWHFIIKNNEEIIIVQIAGLIARRIVSFVSDGQNLDAGERFGLIRFGSRVDIYMPLSTTIQCSVGDKVVAGVSVLARLQDRP